MKEKQGNVKLKMLKIIFKTTCKNTKDDKYGEIRRYITGNKIGLDEAIYTLKDEDFFSTDEFEDSILENSKLDNPDLLFQIKLRRENMLGKANESLQKEENRKREIEVQIENKQGEIKRKKEEIKKLKGTYSPTIKAISESDYKLQPKLYSRNNSPANFDKRLQDEQKRKEYLNNNRVFFDELMNNIIQESKGNMETLDQLCLELERTYRVLIGESGVKQILEEKCQELVEYRRSLKEQRIEKLENEIRQIEKEIEDFEKEKKRTEEELSEIQGIALEIKQDIDTIDSKLPEQLKGTKEERDKREQEKKKKQEAQEAYESRREMEEYYGPGWQG